MPGGDRVLAVAHTPGCKFIRIDLVHHRLRRPTVTAPSTACRVYALDSIVIIVHTWWVKWEVDLHNDFLLEYRELHKDVQDELLACIELLEQFGPQLGRPRVDTLNDSRHANMKELRFDAADGVWRVVFAFDPNRKAILLVAGDKSGVSEKRFYRQLTDKADARFDAHLAQIKRHKGKERK